MVETPDDDGGRLSFTSAWVAAGNMCGGDLPVVQTRGGLTGRNIPKPVPYLEIFVEKLL